MVAPKIGERRYSYKYRALTNCATGAPERRYSENHSLRGAETLTLESQYWYEIKL
jgi:hypothetical protein